MKAVNKWTLVKDEGEVIIGKIISGDCKCREEYHNYCDSLYCWKIADKIKDYVNLYLMLNDIDLPWRETEVAE